MLDVWASLGGLSGQSAAQEASRNGVAAREKRYADCGLEDMWAKRTPAQAFEVLSQPDVTVTNASDKVVQLEKLIMLDTRVRTALRQGA